MGLLPASVYCKHPRHRSETRTGWRTLRPVVRPYASGNDHARGATREVRTDSLLTGGQDRRNIVPAMSNSSLRTPENVRRHLRFEFLNFDEIVDQLDVLFFVRHLKFSLCWEPSEAQKLQ